jgi:hypothetical protein
MKVLAYAEKRLAPALCGNGCVKRHCWALDAILLSAGINKIIRVTFDFGLPRRIGQTVQIKKRRGRPPTGRGTLIGVRIQPDDLAMLDSDDGRGLTRPQAIRRLVETALSRVSLALAFVSS